jgi:hypothetical protein
MAANDPPRMFNLGFNVHMRGFVLAPFIRVLRCGDCSMSKLFLAETYLWCNTFSRLYKSTSLMISDLVSLAL